MTRREALKLLQITTLYPEIKIVQEQYDKLQKLYNPESKSPNNYKIYVQLLRQLTQAYTKIANDDGFESFTDESYYSEENTINNSETLYRDIFLESGFFGVIGEFFKRIIPSPLASIFGRHSNDKTQSGEADNHKQKKKQRKKTKNSKKEHSREQREKERSKTKENKEKRRKQRRNNQKKKDGRKRTRK